MWHHASTMRACVLCFALLAVSGCGKRSTQGGVTVVVNVASTVRATCVSVVAATTSGGAEQSTAKVPRKDTLRFGVASGGGLEGEVRFVARGWLGPDCSQLNAESAPQTYRFIAGRASDTVTLEVTGALDDGDLDGYRAQQAGGTDCKDDAGMVHPDADELCTNAEDDDCNGLIDCADSPRCDGVSCNDGKGCTSNDSCRSGACVGHATTCNAPPGECYRGPASCTDDGGCLFVVDAGTRCDGGSCRPDGTCAPNGTEADCTDGRDDDLDGLLDCLDVADCATRLCAAANLCSTMNRCAADGGCEGVPRDCSTAPGPCFAGDAGACSPATGQCVWPVRPGSCDDGLACTAGDACGADGGCAGAPVTCSVADDGGCFAPMGRCVEPTGACAFTARGGFSCNDGVACSAGDTCSDAGTCAGVMYTCAAPPECHQPGTCEGDGGCRFVQSALGTPCDAGSCQADGGCRPAVPSGPWPYEPSNFAPTRIPDSGIAGTLVIDCANAVFDSTLGIFAPGCIGQPIITPLSLQQDGGPDVWVLPVAGLLVTDGGALRLQGDRPVIFAVYGDVVIAGRVLAHSARADLVQGAGGTSLLNRARCGARAGGDGTFSTVGGGGGGGALAGAGGRGGDSLDAGGGAAGVDAQRASLQPLVGGCPGGSGGGLGSGLGVAGGGALQVSATGSVAVRGLVTVSGAGGLHGNFDDTGGGGAGSGGGVLLEGSAVRVEPTGRITANGGGGGAGAGSSGVAADGEDGSLLGTAPAPGGAPAQGGERGGAGGTGDAGAGAGTAGVAGGGGGGATAGVLRLNGHPQCGVSGGAVVSAVTTTNGCN